MENLKEKMNPLPVLTGERIVLRKMEGRDAAGVFAVASDPAVSRFVSWEPHTSVEQSEAFIASELKRAQEGERWSWAITEKERNTFIGFILLCPAKTQPRSEVGYWLGKPYWGKGYMTEALKLLIKLSFEELGLNRVQATHSTLNPASGRVMTKAGMTYEATLRQYIIIKGVPHDACMYSILREEYFGEKQREKCT